MTTAMTYREHADQSHDGTYLACKVCRANVTYDTVVDEPAPVVTVAPEIIERRVRIAAEIDRINDAIEADHIATEGVHVSQLRIERRALFAELDALPRPTRTAYEPAGEVRSLAD